MFFIKITSATMIAPTPECNVTGIVKDIIYKEAWSCITDNSCVPDGPSSTPEGYSITINVQKVIYNNGPTQYSTCEEIYPVNLDREFFIEKSKFDNNPLIKNQIVEYYSERWYSSADSYKIIKSNVSWNNNLYLILGLILLVIIIRLIFFLIYKKKK